MMPLDKQAHAWAGLAIMLSVSLFGGWAIGLAAAFVAAIGKEVIDSMGFGTPDPWDAVATIAGGIVGTVLYLTAGVL